MCDHGNDKDCTYIKVFGNLAEVYMCECGALVNLDDTRARGGYRAMTPGELAELVQELLDDKFEAIRNKVKEAIEGA